MTIVVDGTDGSGGAPNTAASRSMSARSAWMAGAGIVSLGAGAIHAAAIGVHAEVRFNDVVVCRHDLDARDDADEDERAQSERGPEISHRHTERLEVVGRTRVGVDRGEEPQGREVRQHG